MAAERIPGAEKDMEIELFESIAEETETFEEIYQRILERVSKWNPERDQEKVFNLSQWALVISDVLWFYKNIILIMPNIAVFRTINETIDNFMGSLYAGEEPGHFRKAVLPLFDLWEFFTVDSKEWTFAMHCLALAHTKHAEFLHLCTSAIRATDAWCPDKGVVFKELLRIFESVSKDLLL